MRVSFEPGEKTLRVPFGTPEPIRFHDGELDLDLAVRFTGFAAVGQGPDEDEDELRRQLRRAAAEALKTLLEGGGWTFHMLLRQGEALEEALEGLLAWEGRKTGIEIVGMKPDEASEQALREATARYWDAHPLPPAPVDSPMMDGPGAYPQSPGGFGLYRMGETPAIASRSCPSCGREAPSKANFCPQCGAKLSS